MTTETVLPKMGLNYDWDLGNSTWKEGMDANLFKLNFMTQISVISATTSAQPGSPSNGDTYIVGSSATGANWPGHEEDLAVYYNGWFFYSPVKGWKAFAEDSNQTYTFETSWKLPGALYTAYADDTAAEAGGVPIGGVYINDSTKALCIRTV